ncbi:MAG: DNA gyrase subunit A, partial [Candidatus Sedimenticola endophacoides]
QAILELRLHRLTGLEQDKILGEYSDILEKIRYLLDILASPERLMEVIREELTAIQEQYSDQRRTEIIHTRLDLTLEDLITEEDVVVTLSHAGYAKAQSLDTYRAQRRGGRGKSAAQTKDEDFIDKLFVANTHDTILCFSSRGKVYWLKVYELPQAGRNARGKPIVNLLPLESGERINAVLPVREYDEQRYVFMATGSGTVKKTRLADFSRPRASGIIAVDLREDDTLVGVALTDGSQDVMLFTSAGKAVRFEESKVRPMGRTACGVRGVRLGEGQRVISLIIAESGRTVLTVTENGFGKRTPVEQFPVKGRGGMGVISIKTSERNGAQVGAVLVDENEEIMLISDGGTLVRTPVDDISLMGRDTQGVTVIRLTNGEKLVGMARIESLANEDEGLDDAEGDTVE